MCVSVFPMTLTHEKKQGETSTIFSFSLNSIIENLQEIAKNPDYCKAILTTLSIHETIHKRYNVFVIKTEHTC